MTHTILTLEESIVSDEIREILYAKLPLRFWVKADLTETCWIWTATRKRKELGRSYGAFSWQGKSQSVHRLIWKLLYGEIPPKMVICHKCDNPPCFNPSHLFLGTTADNAADCNRKGRHSWGIPKLRGEQVHNAKFTDEQVREIKIELANGGKIREIARRFHVYNQTIEKIKNGTRWGHITINAEPANAA
jgi:hypothetical protein